MENKKYHVTVLLKDAVDALNVKPDGKYLDCTLGEAGHSLAILKKLDEKGTLVSLDQDQDAIDFVKDFYKSELKQNWIIERSNFSNLDRVCNKVGVNELDGVLMDLGLSSRQLEASERGFSYLEGSQDLDMRMNTEMNAKAIDLLKFYDEKTLSLIFRRYGEENNAPRIAKFIKENINEIETVDDINKLILRAVPAAQYDTHKHPSRRVFQALRIAVNDELGSLESGLEKAYNLLKKEGVLVVISFHSLEDRITKQFFKKKAVEEGAEVSKQPIIPSKEEIQVNNRSRSAKMRILIKK